MEFQEVLLRGVTDKNGITPGMQKWNRKVRENVREFFQNVDCQTKYLKFSSFSAIRNATSGQTPVIYTDHWSGNAGNSQGGWTPCVQNAEGFCGLILRERLGFCGLVLRAGLGIAYVKLL